MQHDRTLYKTEITISKLIVNLNGNNKMTCEYKILNRIVSY
jgi:hypothetical protein